MWFLLTQMLGIHGLTCQPIALFTSSADEIYGPITTLRRKNQVVKHIPWRAFKMADPDWTRVTDARDILAVSLFNGRY
jgi:hypothetical protein